MYGLKKDIDWSFLQGREVGQIAIGLYQVQFGFDEDVRISVEAEFRYFDGREEWNWKPEPGEAQVGCCHGPSTAWPTLARRERGRKSATAVGMTEAGGRGWLLVFGRCVGLGCCRGPSTAGHK